MFERSACATAHLAAGAQTDLAALTTLSALLRHVLNGHSISSNARVSGAPKLSRDQNRGEVHALTHPLIFFEIKESEAGGIRMKRIGAAY